MNEDFLETYVNKSGHVECPHCNQEFLILYKFSIRAHGYIPLTKEELKAFVGEE